MEPVTNTPDYARQESFVIVVNSHNAFDRYIAGRDGTFEIADWMGATRTGQRLRIFNKGAIKLVKQAVFEFSKCR